MTDRPLRILLTVDPEIPVPPRLYGGIERIVDMLARRFEAAGHDVHLTAHPESSTAGTAPAARVAASSRMCRGFDIDRSCYRGCRPLDNDTAAGSPLVNIAGKAPGGGGTLRYPPLPASRRPVIASRLEKEGYEALRSSQVVFVA